MIATTKISPKIHPSFPLASLTSWRVGGIAEWFAAPHSVLELEKVLAWAAENDQPITFMGAGSNLLISDLGIEGLVICLRHFRGIHFDEERAQVVAAAGEPIARLAMQAAAKGWSGLEWAVGIPGTVGGLVVMNAGAQGGCASDRLLQAETISTRGKIKTFLPEDLGFSYRTSTLQGGTHILTAATLQLIPGFDPQQITTSTQDHLKYRHTVQPYHLPSCGSVFRNPYPQAAAQLIEQTGLKGYQIGDAQVSKLHANFIVNCGHATAREIHTLIAYVQEKVEQKWSVKLETEVKMLGFS